jgi:LmbE family N-acetylglucosaminyl deacetylase
VAANEPGQPALSGSEWSRDLTVPSSALAIGAHPDDIEFGAGGTLAKWAAAGCVVHHLVCTDGSKGTWNPDADIEALIAIRQREQRAAAAALGATGEVVFLGHVDGELESTLAIRGDVARWIRLLRPDVVLGHDPWKRYRLHPDHRHAGLLACEGIVAARDPHFFRDHGLAPHRPSRLLLWEADEPDHLEDVSAFVDTKLRALEAHESQFESTMKARDEAQLDAFRVRIRSRLAGHGTRVGVPAAEIFKLISDL